jgi:hypothetical protein
MRPMELTVEDRAVLAGDRGEGAALAMRIVAALGTALGAERLLDVVGAHIDGCLYHGQAGLDLATRLVEGGASVGVPTTLNVSSLDLLHPGLVRLDDETAAQARALMDAYVTLGCRPTWTCAPYQLPERPALGAHVAWAESNAIVFANSVLGARTDRYGDFVDIAAAITGRAPAAGLHLDRHRGASLVFRLAGVPEPLLRTTAGGAALGHLVGRRSGTQVPAIVGLPADTDEDVLKALGATAASSGSVALFHAVGRTPEAPTLEAVLAPGAGEATIGPDDLRAARDELTSASADTELGAVSLGTPHASLDELRRLAGLLTDRVRIPVYVNTGRATWEEARRRGLAPTIEDAGVTVVTDTCTYVTPILHGVEGAVMTDSGKWAWYAPGNLGVDVVFGTLEDCVRSALSGVVDRDEELWG